MSESKIVHENPTAWVCSQRNSYTVYRIGLTHSTPDSSYAKTPDGLSIAKARAEYLHKRALGNVSAPVAD